MHFSGRDAIDFYPVEKKVQTSLERLNFWPSVASVSKINLSIFDSSLNQLNMFIFYLYNRLGFVNLKMIHLKDHPLLIYK